MAKKQKKVNDLDDAKVNKDAYIKGNYLVDVPEAKPAMTKNKRIITAMMLSLLLVCLAFVVYWIYFINPINSKTIEHLQATAIIELTPAPSMDDSALFVSTPTPRPILSKYDEYLEIYPDIVGWISIDNIKVDNPVVQNPDPSNPFKYLDLGPDENPSKYGALFLDIRNSIDVSDRHTIIYGHNMRDGSMFGQLHKYQSRSFFTDHLIIRYDTLYQELEWEVFNIFITNTEFYYIQTYFASDEDFVSLMTQCIYKSYYNNNQTVISPDDHILTLSTCTNDTDDGRLVVQARLITPLND